MADVKETRIGLVLNGGLSLAVWMGGVTHEIDLLRRASRCAIGLDERPEVAAYDRPIFDTWVRFCRKHGVGRVLVDVIAGTSAGGLNGALLATAVGRGVPLDPDRGDGAGPRLREMWNTSAELADDRLLRRAGRPTVPSLLDGEFFQTTVREQLHGVGATDVAARPDEPVTLFVTATALGNMTTRYTDSFEHPFDIADHRRLYRFVRTEDGVCTFVPREGSPDASWFPDDRHNDFRRPADDDADGVDPLSRAARATASFPIAFAPVIETPELVDQRVLPPPQLDDADGDPVWLADGGILNNSPFEPVLSAITSRQVSGEVDRLLIYVVPSEGVRAVDWKQADDPAATPDGAAGTADDRAAAAPTHDAWKSIAVKALGMPSESDLRNDIEQTHRLVSRAEGATAGPEALFSDAIRRLTATDVEAGADRRTLERSAAGLCAQYRVARTVGGVLEARAAVGVAHRGPSTALRPGRVADADRLLAEHRPAWIPPADAGLHPDAFDDRVEGWCWGLHAAERVCRLMLRDLRRNPPAGRDVGEALATISAAQVRIEAVRATVTDALRALDREDLHDAGHDADVALIDEVGALFARLRVPVALLWCLNEAATAYASTVDGVEPDDVVRVGLAVEVASQAFTAYRPAERTPPFKLLRLGPDVDTPACDRARGVTRGEPVPDTKLYGARLGHFGAFGLQPWRTWDWMCGRLDAQAHLARALSAATADAEGVEETIIELQEATLASEGAGLTDGGDGLSPEVFAERREELIATTDATLLRELGATTEGRTMLTAVFDAAMRAVPHDLALAGRGRLVNTLLARSPERWLPPLWAPVARIATRLWWRGRVRSLTKGR